MANLFAIIALSITLAGAAPDAGPHLNPGNWEFSSTTMMPGMGEPSVKTVTDCITPAEAQKDPLANLLQGGACKISDRKVDGNILRFQIECALGSGARSKGKGHFTSDGDSASGGMQLDMTMPGMPGTPDMPDAVGGATVTQKWTGRRVGGCVKGL